LEEALAAPDRLIVLSGKALREDSGVASLHELFFDQKNREGNGDSQRTPSCLFYERGPIGINDKRCSRDHVVKYLTEPVTHVALFVVSGTSKLLYTYPLTRVLKAYSFWCLDSAGHQVLFGFLELVNPELLKPGHQLREETGVSCNPASYHAQAFTLLGNVVGKSLQR
jgi:hypothetical protein